MQENKTTNKRELTDIKGVPEKGRLLCLDPGTKRVGVAVSDEIQFTVRSVCIVERKSWKKFLIKIAAIIEEFDAKALVIGLPYNFDGSESEMSAEARRIARNFSLSLEIPVYLHDERLSTYTARGNLWERGVDTEEFRDKLDSEAAAVILEDFIRVKNKSS